MGTPEEIYAYIRLLQGESTYLYSSEVIGKEMAYDFLKEWTDEDFGYDIEAWEKYFSKFDLSNIDGIMAALKGRTRIIEERKKSRKTNEGSNQQG